MQDRYLDRREAADYLTNQRGLQNLAEHFAENGNARRWPSLSRFWHSRDLREGRSGKLGRRKTFRQAVLHK